MSCCKTDSYYETRVDDMPGSNHYDPKDEDDVEPVFVQRQPWHDEHYTVLVEIFNTFKRTGELFFGRAFFQYGDLADFITFVRRHTII